MAITYVDTQKCREISSNIISSANQLDVLFNKLFKRFSEVPYVTKEWVGQTSQKYFSIVSLEKSDFLDFSDKLKEFGKKISEDMDQIENSINENKKLEKKKDYV